MDCALTVELYNESKKDEWDSFISSSANGTFLQTKRFLDYHPTTRFVDCSLMIYDKGKLIAVCPACKVVDGEEIVFFSHKGSTFGGIIVEAKQYVIHRLIPIINAVEEYCGNNGFSQIVLKQTPDLFSKMPNDLIEYVLYYCGYSESKELNLYIDFSTYGENTLSNFSQGKRTNINNCLKTGVELKKIFADDDIRVFYDILCSTLEKYNKVPVHTLDELFLLRDKIITNEVEFFGAYLNGKMIAGSMMFYFTEANVAHTQYLCALHEYDKLSPMSFMYYAMIESARERSFRAISFGIATEDGGRYLNSGLVASKEAFGAKHSINRIYSKTLLNERGLL